MKKSTSDVIYKVNITRNYRLHILWKFSYIKVMRLQEIFPVFSLRYFRISNKAFIVWIQLSKTV